MKDEWVWRNQGRRIKEQHRNREGVVIIPMGFNTSCAPEKGRESLPGSGGGVISVLDCSHKRQQA